MSEERVRDSVYISEVPEGGRVEVYYRGRKVAERVGKGEIRRY